MNFLDDLESLGFVLIGSDGGRYTNYRHESANMFLKCNNFDVRVLHNDVEISLDKGFVQTMDYVKNVVRSEKIKKILK